MPKRIVPLSDTQIKNAKTKEKDYKLADGGGLFLLVASTGGKLWRMKYTNAGKERLLSFGSYPAVTLSDARQRREEAKKLLANGIDPSEAKKAHKAAMEVISVNTFEKISRDWHSQKQGDWTENHAKRLLRGLEVDVFPFIGSKPINEIRTPELAELLERIASRTLETAHRMKIAIDMTFKYAVVRGKCEQNPAASLRGLLPTVKNKHMSAPTDPKDVAPLLRAIDGFTGSFVVKSAMQIAPLLFVRPVELRNAEWSEIDLEAAEWNIPAEKMKMRVAHLVPLSQQAIEILRELQPLTGHSKYVFPCHRTPLRCMSENAVNAGLRRLGFDKNEITGHGFRAMARTILDEVLQFRPDIVEHQLAHKVKDPLGRAYNRTSFLPERRQMMQTWADYLDGLKSGAKVIPMMK